MLGRSVSSGGHSRTLAQARPFPPRVQLGGAACRTPRFGGVSGDPRTRKRRPGRPFCRPHHAAVRRHKRSVPSSCRQVPRPRNRSVSEDPLVHLSPVSSSRLPCGSRTTPGVSKRAVQERAAIVIERSKYVGLPVQFQPTQRRLLAADLPERPSDRHGDCAGK